MPQKNKSTLRRVMRWIERLFVVGAVVFIAYRLGPQLGALTGLRLGEEVAPPFQFSTLDGQQIDSSELRGSVVVLNFWATWCGPCRLEMPSLQSLHEDRASDGVVVLGLSVDVAPDQKIVDFLAEHKIDYPVGMATNAHRRDFGGVSMLPSTFIIDRKGMIRHEVTGYFAGPALRVAVDRLLSEPS